MRITPFILLSLPACLFCQVIDGDTIYHVLPKDAIPAIYDPVLVTADEAESFMSAQELVLGVVGPSGTAVAYSTWHLDHHEIVNDVIDGLPIAATW